MPSPEKENQTPPSSEDDGGDRGFFAVFVVGIAAISFSVGAGVMLAEVPPSQYLRNAWSAGVALWEKETQYNDIGRLDFWAPARNDKKGVTIYDENKAENGLTLYSSGDGPHAVLIDMKGNIVHEWNTPFSKIYNDSSPIKNPQKDEYMHWHTAKMQPNGDLIVQYTAAGDTPYGYGLARIDKDSNVVWGYLGTAHHDFSVDKDGKVYALTQEFRNNTYQYRNQLKPPRLDDFAVILSPEGKELKKVSILDAIINSPYDHLIDFVPYYSKDDVLHTNTIEVITAETAQNFPYGKEGDVLLSFRDLGILAVLDMNQKKIVWATRGSWLGQHDPDLLPNGDILLFDNQGQLDDPDAGMSRVLQIDPKTGGITWEYDGSKDNYFYSDIRSDQERLPNGNTLITESTPGRLFEVNKDGEIVWEFYNPIRRDNPEKADEKLIPIVSQAERISDDRAALFSSPTKGEDQ